MQRKGVSLMENKPDKQELPLGLGMALAQNIDAMSYFASQTADRQREIIDATHGISSKSEMRRYVDSLGGNLMI